MKQTFRTAGLLLILGGICFGHESARKPNIIFIAIDDQNDWIGCLNGHAQVRTPHIDSLASRGTVFLNAHCQSPLCNPSRTSVMTGRRPSSTGIYGLSPWFRDVAALRDIVSLPQHLRVNGYRTLTTGKIYHGSFGTRKSDNEFDVVGTPSTVGPRPSAVLVKTPSGHPLVDWGVFPHQDEDKGDWKVASWAIEQLKLKHEKPFFLSAGFFLPHVPCYATQRWFDLYPEESLLLPPFLPEDRDDTSRFSWYLHWKLPEPRQQFLADSRQWKNLVRSYLACTSFMDSQVGRVLDALAASEYADQTVVVLWSDHGWHLGEKLITGKNSLWERSTRVPLIFAGPGISAGGRCQEPAELLDIFPTLTEICGLPMPSGLEGHSLVPQLLKADTPREFPAITTHNHDNHAIRSRDWRYIRYADGSEELYDMRADPSEWRNLAGVSQYAEVQSELCRWIPPVSQRPAAGSEHRILTFETATGVVTWEGDQILPGTPIPEID